MPRQTFKYRDGRMVDAEGFPMLNQAERAAPPAMPMVISDTMSDMQSQTNGRMYSSKSELRKEYKRAGVEEVGNEKQTRGPSWMEAREKKKKHRQECKDALLRAHSRQGKGSVY